MEPPSTTPLPVSVSTVGTDRQAAFGAAFDEYHRRALHVAGLLHGSRADAEDAVSEAFARIWRRYRHTDIEALWPYLRTALLNDFRSGLKRKALERRETERAKAQGTFETTGSISRIGPREEMVEALRQLPPRQRAAVVLRYFDDLSEAETASALGCSVGTVKSSVSRGLERLRSILGTDPSNEEHR